MARTLSESIVFLTSYGKNGRYTVTRYIWGFHNLPKAFLSAEDPMKITADEAMAYYKPYLKLD